MWLLSPGATCEGRFQKGEVLKNSNVTRRARKPNGSNSWTLLLIGELGNTMSFRLSKSLIATLMACAVASLALMVFLIVSYYGVRTENKGLKRDLESIRADLVEANKGKERALVRLMVLEGPVKPDDEKEEPSSSQKPPEKAPEGPSSPGPVREETKDVVPEPVKPVEVPSSAESIEAAAEAPGPMTPERVSVEKLEINQGAGGHLLAYRFVLTNIDPQGNRVKGYTFVVLNPEKGSEQPSVVSPSVPLEDGKPAVFKKGKYFSITRFKPVSGSFPDGEAMESYESATVYVYSEDGNRLVVEGFQIDKMLGSQTEVTQ